MENFIFCSVFDNGSSPKLTNHFIVQIGLIFTHLALLSYFFLKSDFQNWHFIPWMVTNYREKIRSIARYWQIVVNWFESNFSIYLNCINVFLNLFKFWIYPKRQWNTAVLHKLDLIRLPKFGYRKLRHFISILLQLYLSHRIALLWPFIDSAALKLVPRVLN